MYLSLFDTGRGALHSKCDNYRFKLWRIWDESLPKVLFIMLNPSTADSFNDDPTVRRCIHFAKSWGFGGLYIGNLFAARSSDPKELLKINDPIGRDNIKYLKEMSNECTVAICAWGNSPILNKILPEDYKPLASISIPIQYLDLAKDGTPKHPLYLRGDLIPQEFYIKSVLI